MPQLPSTNSQMQMQLISNMAFYNITVDVFKCARPAPCVVETTELLLQPACKTDGYCRCNCKMEMWLQVETLVGALVGLRQRATASPSSGVTKGNSSETWFADQRGRGGITLYVAGVLRCRRQEGREASGRREGP